MSSAASWLDALSVKKIREVDRLNSFYEGDIFYGFLFASLHTSPLLKRSLPWKGRKFFLFRVDLLSEWRQEQSWQEFCPLKAYVCNILWKMKQDTTWEKFPWYVSPMKTQISLHICAVWSIFIVHMKKLCILGYPKFSWCRFWSDSMNAQVIWIFAGHTYLKVCFLFAAQIFNFISLKLFFTFIWHSFR